MRRAIDEIPDAVARLASPASQERLRAVARRLKELDPGVVLTVGRGSSDHAATYLKYAIEIALGRPVASIGPSIATVYGAKLHVSGLVALAVSQSGGSGDLVTLAQSLTRGGCAVVAVTNSARSPLAESATHVVDVAAGPERAVAATKSFVNSVVAGLWIVAFWSGDHDLEAALQSLPETLRHGGEEPVGDEVLTALGKTERAVVIGRGPGLGIAQETALKLIETCGIHASAYSAAEVLHGPNAILKSGYPVLALATAESGLDQAIERLSRQGAQVTVIGRAGRPMHRLVDPLLPLPALYRAVEQVSRARGLSPDAPSFLTKETSTL